MLLHHSAQARRRRTPGWIAVCTAAFVAACGGGGGDAGDALTPNEARLASAAGGELVAYFKARIAQRAAQGLPGTAITFPTVGVLSRAGSVVRYAGSLLDGAEAQEDHLLQADDSMVYSLNRGYTTDAGVQQGPWLSAMLREPDGALRPVGRVDLDAQYIPQGMYLTQGATRAVVLSQHNPYADRQPVVGAGAAPQIVPEVSRTLSVDVFAVARGAVPAQVRQVRIDGLLLGTRLVGNTLVVVSTWSPDLGRFAVPAGATAAVVQAALADLKPADLLPTLRVDGGQPQPLVAEDACLVQRGNASLALQLTTVTAIDLASSSLARNSRCFVGGHEAAYLGESSVVLASSRQYRYSGNIGDTVFPADSRTDLHRFALSGVQVSYRGSGSVEGHLGWEARRLPDRISEYQGDLRVLTFTGSTGQTGEPPVTIQSRPVSPARITVLREDALDQRLSVRAVLPITQRLSPMGHAGQQVDTVHFIGPRAYAATFQPSDPLLVIDLSNPDQPRQAGELAAWGYADHLVGLPNGLLLGVGNDSTAGGAHDGIQLALFDVLDPARGRLISVDTLGLRGSLTALEASPKALAVSRQGTRVQVAFGARIYQSPVAPASGDAAVLGYQGAARLEVDTAAGTLRLQPMLVSLALRNTDMPELYGRYLLANERSLWRGGTLYHLSGGQTFQQLVN